MLFSKSNLDGKFLFSISNLKFFKYYLSILKVNRAKQSKAKQSKAKQSKAKQSKAKQSSSHTTCNKHGI